ncbi:MAG: hypothetical protein PVF06_04025, partial [Gammaproteobacteria bacterium]
MKRSSFLQEARQFTIGWRVWFWALSIVNLVMPLIFISRPEAQLTLVAYVIAATTIVLMHRHMGWVRLLGVGHFPWLVLVPWLILSYLETTPEGVFALWLITVITVDLLCLAIDIVDLYRYAAGERAPLVRSAPR